MLSAVDTFADIGCDHGYCSEYMLKNKLCAHATITDISADCLKKAEILLKEYVEQGVCTPLCTNGLKGVDKNTNLVLIAGMGGMEIAHILTAKDGFIPERFVFQPMRDAAAVRKILTVRGAKIERDFTFYDGKFYDVIVGERNGGTGNYTENYTEAEFLFGRDNIRERGEDFLNFLHAEIKKRKEILSRPLGETARANAEEKLKYLQGVESGEIK